MKNKYLSIAVIISLLILPLFYSCIKTGNTSDKCANIACDYFQPTFILDFVDKQGRDLLSPATPGHFDSLKIVQLNGATVRLYPPGIAQPNINHRKMTVAWSAPQTTIYLKLSDTDQDTITYTYKTIGDCCPGNQLTGFSYNGKAYADSVGKGYFTIVK